MSLIRYKIGVDEKRKWLLKRRIEKVGMQNDLTTRRIKSVNRVETLVGTVCIQCMVMPK